MDFSHFFHLARRMHSCLHSRTNQQRQSTGSKDMNISATNLHQVAISIFGALLASSLFISAAVGPVAQFV